MIQAHSLATLQPKDQETVFTCEHETNEFHWHWCSQPLVRNTSEDKPIAARFLALCPLCEIQFRQAQQAGRLTTLYLLLLTRRVALFQAKGK